MEFLIGIRFWNSKWLLAVGCWQLTMDSWQLTVKKSFGFQVQSFEFQISSFEFQNYCKPAIAICLSYRFFPIRQFYDSTVLQFYCSTVLRFYNSTIFQLSESRLPAGRQGLFRLHGLHGFLKCSNCHRYLPSLSPFPITQLHNYTITQLHDSTVLQFYSSTSLC